MKKHTVTINITGVPNSGKTSIAKYIETMCQGYGFEHEINDEDRQFISDVDNTRRLAVIAENTKIVVNVEMLKRNTKVGS